MSETDLAWFPATELAALVRSRRVSPIEIVDAVWARIEAVEPRINAFTTILAESELLGQLHFQFRAFRCGLA
jgi:aspartyl-tRNA(Asn)/glutamyl-tRNA(Gln) amidotransferase subunit A